MNKKFFLGMFAAAGMLLATSCSNDELDRVQSGNEAQVTFSLGLEGGIATRAISDGESADKLVCAVYDVNNNLLARSVINGEAVNNDGQFVKVGAFANGLTDNVVATLAKGQTYTIAFWAQSSNCGAYDTDDLTNVEIDYAGVNNDEDRDAFFATETFKVNGNATINVTLKRPFAQINVGVTAYDWAAAVGSGVKIKDSKVVIKNAANSINLLDGSVDGEVAVVYDFATIPYQFTTPETLNVDTNGDGVKENYKYLSMSYILVNDANGGSSKATLESEGLQFTFRPESGNDILFFEGLNNVPVQRNWRTNILGKILTGDVEFNITIDPIYDGEYNNTDNFQGNKVGLNGTYYETIEEALAVANDGDVIYVGQNTYNALPKITEKVTLICQEGTVFEGNHKFNIAGSTIVGATFQGVNNQVSNSTSINGIFKDCIFNGDLKYSYAGETVVFENCEFNGPDYALHFDANATGATNTRVVLNNCVINSNWRVAIGGAISMFEATDCKFNVRGFVNMHGKATLTNCEFSKPEYWIANADYAEYTNCKYEGRALTANDLYIASPLVKVNGEYYASTVDGFNTAINNGANTVNLTAGVFEKVDLYNIPYRETLTIKGSVGTKISFSKLQVRASQFKELKIQNCEILRMPDKSWGHLVFSSSDNAEGVYTVENCTFIGVGTQGIYINENTTGATYNILNCTFDGDFGNEGAITIQTNKDVKHVVNVKGCTFNNIPDTSHKIFMVSSDDGLYYGWTLNTDLAESDVVWP